jgi:hypothetical protein
METISLFLKDNKDLIEILLLLGGFVGAFVFLIVYEVTHQPCIDNCHNFVLSSTSSTYDHYDCSNKSCGHSKGVHKAVKEMGRGNNVTT